MTAPTPPHSPELERAVLAVLLDGRHAEAWQVFQDRCPRVAAFFARDHRLVVLGMHRVASAGHKVDAQAVIDALFQMPFADAMEAIQRNFKGDLDIEAVPKVEHRTVTANESVLMAIGGPNAVFDMMQSFGPVSGFARNAELVADLYRQRRAAAVIRDLLDHFTAIDGREAGPRIDDAMAVLGSLRQSTPGAAHTMAEAGAAVLVEHDTAQAAPRAVATWGVPSLDRVCPLRPGRLVTLAAPPMCGKTSLGLQALAATVELHGKGAGALATMEQPATEVASILIAREIGASAQDIAAGTLSGSQRLRAAEATTRWQANDAWVRDATAATVTVDAIVTWARQCAQKGGMVLLVIDYLQIIAPKHGKQTEYEKITEATRKLKLLAIELRICVLMLAQYNREGTKPGRDRGGKVLAAPEPRIQDLRGSGSIEQDSDTILLLWPDGEKRARTPMHAKVDKHRAGDLARIRLMFHRADGQRFTDDDPPPVDPRRAERLRAPPSASEDRFANADDGTIPARPADSPRAVLAPTPTSTWRDYSDSQDGE